MENKTMKTRFIMTALLAGCALLLIDGCSKHGFSPKGGRVSIGATSGPAATKTAYGDDFTNNGTKYQQINWVAGDILRVVSDEAGVYNNLSNLHFADYTVTNVTAQANGSKADAEHTDPNGLCWSGGEELHHFYAVFPSPVTTGSTTAIIAPDAEGNLAPGAITGTVTATIPQEQGWAEVNGNIQPDMKYAVMTAYTAARESATQPQISLHFKPAFTAIEFTIRAKNEFILRQFALESTGTDYLWGTYSLTAGADVIGTGAVTVAEASQTAANQTLHVDFGTVTVTDEDTCTFTVFLIPKTNASALTVRFTNAENETCSLTLKTQGGQVVPFTAGAKTRVKGLILPDRFGKISLQMTVEGWETISNTLVVE